MTTNTKPFLTKDGVSDADLLPASRDLYQALSVLLLAVTIDKVPGIGFATDKACAALAKAEGRAA